LIEKCREGVTERPLATNNLNKGTAVVLMVLYLEPFPGFLVKFAYSVVLRKGFPEKCIA
jgi:hypothetical protein